MVFLVFLVEDSRPRLSGQRRAAVLHRIEIRDRLPPAVVENLKIAGRQAAHRLAIGTGDRDIDVDDGNLDFFGERRLLRDGHSGY